MAISQLLFFQVREPSSTFWFPLLHPTTFLGDTMNSKQRRSSELGGNEWRLESIRRMAIILRRASFPFSWLSVFELLIEQLRAPLLGQKKPEAAAKNTRRAFRTFQGCTHKSSKDIHGFVLKNHRSINYSWIIIHRFLRSVHAYVWLGLVTFLTNVGFTFVGDRWESWGDLGELRG